MSKWPTILPLSGQQVSDEKFLAFGMFGLHVSRSADDRTRFDQGRG